MVARSRKPIRSKSSYAALIADVARDRFLKARGFSKSDIRHVVDMLVDIMGQHLISQEEIHIKGFGYFYRIFKKARKIRNPQTSEMMTIPGRFEVRFSMGSRLKALLGNKVKSETVHWSAKVLEERKQFEQTIEPQPKKSRKDLPTDV